MSPIKIRPMSDRDVEAAARLERACFSSPWSEQSLREELRNPLAALFVAQMGEELAGYAGMLSVAGEGYVGNVAVFPEFRRQGVASALMKSLISNAGAGSLDFLSLEVRASNSAAIALYRRFGFEIAGHRRDFYIMPREDALIMTKYLHRAEPKQKQDV